MVDFDKLIAVTEALDYITAVLMVLSLFGCFATVLTFLIFNEMRTYPIKLIIYLCLSIFWAQLFFYLTFYLYESIMCIPSAMILHYFFLAGFFWTFCVAFNFYQMIVRRNRDAETLEKLYHILCWGLPLIVVVIVVAMESYANRDGYCYMLSGYPIFLSFFLPGLIIVSANAVIFFFIAREIHDTLKSAPKADKKEKSKEFKVYFSIFVSLGLSWVFGFIMALMTDPVAKIVFLFLYSVTTPTQGFLIFISYCINAKVGSKWAGLVGRVIPWFKRYETLGTTSATSTTSGSSGTSRTSRTANSSRDSSSSASSRDFSASSSASETSSSSSQV